MATVAEILANRTLERARITDPELVHRYEQAIDEIRMGTANGLEAARKYRLNYDSLIRLKRQIIGWKPRRPAGTGKRYAQKRTQYLRRKRFMSSAREAALVKARAAKAEIDAKRMTGSKLNGRIDPAKFTLDLRKLLVNAGVPKDAANETCFTVLEVMVQK